MKQLLLFFLMAFLTSCTLFSKHGGSGDIHKMVEEVLEEDQGFIMRVEPLPEID